MTGRQFRVDRGARDADAAVEGVRTLLGDVLVIESPGGGGYGPPSPDPHQAGEETDDLRAF